MTGSTWFTIIWGVGVLALAGAALASYRLNWQRGLSYAFIWGALFAGVTLLFNLANG